MTVYDTERKAEGHIRAKFYVQAVKLTSWGTSVELNVVTRGEDNKKWSQATPSGQITMQIKNDLAAAMYAPGQEWYVDFTPAPLGKEGMGED